MVGVLVLLCVGWAMAIALAPSVIRANLPSDSRRVRALGMAGRLALPAPDDAQRRDALDRDVKPVNMSAPATVTARGLILTRADLNRELAELRDP